MARDRPFLFSAVFWVVFAATATSSLSLPFVLNLVVVAGLWLALPWTPGHRRRFLAPLFLVATLALGVTGSTFTHTPLSLLGIANLAFLYGMRTAVAILATLAGMVFFAVVGPFGKSLANAVFQVTWMVVLAAFVLGMASAVLEARRGRERIRELAVAEERARMAAEMHDSIGHHLTVIKMDLENAERFRERRPDAAWDEVRHAKELTVQALADARRWVRALRPLALDSKVGSVALEQLAASFDGTDVTVTFEVEGKEHRLESDTELVLYRVLQEGLTNALRHAEARHVHGKLTFSRGQVVLMVRDDGRGRQAGAGFGLSSLAERTRALGGTLVGGDAAGGGFELRAELPVASG